MRTRENFLGLVLLVGTAVACDGASRALVEEASSFVLKAGLGHPGGFAVGVSAEHGGLSAEVLFTRGVVQRVETTLIFSVLELTRGFFRPRIALGAGTGSVSVASVNFSSPTSGWSRARACRLEASRSSVGIAGGFCATAGSAFPPPLSGARP